MYLIPYFQTVICAQVLPEHYQVINYGSPISFVNNQPSKGEESAGTINETCVTAFIYVQKIHSVEW